MTTDELITYRNKAGERFAEAAREFRAAFMDLAAIDGALENGHSGHPEAVRTFGPISPVNLGLFAHPVFAPDVAIGLWSDEVREKRDALIATFAK
jgi:hypothetical protein